MEGAKFQIEKFDGKDFSFWKMQIEDYLYQRGLHKPLLEKKPEAMSQETWKLKDRQALGLIRLSLARNVAFNIVKETTTAGVLKVLANMYEKPSAMNKDTIVSAISSSRGSEKLKFEEIRDIILSESIRKREIGDSFGNALSVDGRGRSKSRRDHSKHGRSKSKGREKSQGKKEVTCWNCGEQGHFKIDCPKPKKKKGQKNNKSHDDNDSICSAEDIGDCLILSMDSPIEQWILDFGASFHASPGRELFQNFKSGYLADNKALEIAGKGDVCIQLLGGSTWKLQDVRYVPDLTKNLIYVGQLDSTGHKTVLEDSS